jgi:hypothetical protein
MRNAQAAEWILSLVTTPERAGSTIGDLMENAARRGTFWFWMGVARTTLSLLWGGVAERPGRMARRAVGAFLLGWGLVLIGSLVIFVPLFALLGPQIPPALFDESNLKFWPWIFVSVVIGGILVPFQQGRWMARWSPGQELAACLSLTILSVGVWASFSTPCRWREAQELPLSSCSRSWHRWFLCLRERCGFAGSGCHTEYEQPG